MKLYPSVVQHIAHNSYADPDRLCMADSRSAFSYSEVWSRIYGLSQRLHELGVTQNRCVAVECSQNAGYMICEFAIQLLGGIFVPIEKNAAAGRLAEILSDTQAVLYIGKDAAKLSAALNAVSYTHLDCCSQLRVCRISFIAYDQMQKLRFRMG